MPSNKNAKGKAARRDKKKLAPKKAKEILHHGSVHGKPLTEKQRKFMGAHARKG